MAVEFRETVLVRDGVECDVYGFVGDGTMDLGIIRIREGKETPRQKVGLDPNFEIIFTEEGYIRGCGSLEIGRPDIPADTYVVNSTTGRFSILVERGEEMKWGTGPGGLIAYEVCKPPYKDGRHIDLD
jgi:hypothetical protein